MNNVNNAYPASRKPLRSLLASSILAILTISASAQEDDAGYDVIQVTAQKRSQDLAEVPIAISTFSQDNISKTGITQLSEMGNFIPNLQISNETDFSSKITIRGVGANSRNIGFDSRVGVYLDGVYLGQSPALNQELVDLARIEVLRGPQGTLFGKNTVAGAISMVSQKPSDMLEGRIEVNAGNLGNRELKGVLNVPVNENGAIKVALSKVERDGYIKNTISGNDLGERDSTAWRLQYHQQLTDRLTLDLSSDGLSGERLSFLGEASYFGISLEQLFTLVPALQLPNYDATQDYFAPKKDEVALNADTYEDRLVRGASMNLSYMTARDYQINAITGYRDTDIYYRNDTDYTPLDFLNIEYRDNYEQWSQEIQLVSPEFERFNYVAGLYWYKQDAFTQRDAINGEYAAIFGNVPGTRVFNQGEVNTKSQAAYINSDITLTDDLDLGIGLRYSHETKSINWTLDGTAGGIFGIGSTNGPMLDERTDSFLSYALSLSYPLANTVKAYVRHATGFKSGGFNLDYVSQSDLAEGIEFDKETASSLEAGLKSHFLNRKLLVNSAVFYTTYDDYQVNQFIDLGNGSSSISIRNAAEVTTKGVEVEVQYRPIPSLEIQASAGLLRAEFDDFPGGLEDRSNAKGKHLPNSPEATAAVSAQYLDSLTNTSIDVLARLEVTWSSAYYTTVDNVSNQPIAFGVGASDFGEVDATTLVNGRVGLLSQNNGWETYLWVRNLFDERQASFNFKDFLGTVVTNYQQPRTWGAEVVYHF